MEISGAVGTLADTKRHDEALADARADLDAATARMEALANRVIERVIRNGCVTRSDVERLRAGDLECRALAATVKSAEAAS